MNSQTPHSNKKKRHKPYFLTNMVTVALNFSKLPAEGKPHVWPLALRVTTKAQIKQASVASKPLKYFKNTFFV